MIIKPQQKWGFIMKSDIRTKIITDVLLVGLLSLQTYSKKNARVFLFGKNYYLLYNNYGEKK